MKTFWGTTLPLAVISAYQLIPERARRALSRPPGTSASARRAVQAGGGWKSFWYYALPRRSAHGGWADWAHYK